MTLLRSATQNAWEGRRGSPDRLHAGVFILPSLQAGEPIGVLRLRLLHSQHVGVDAPDVVARGEGNALRIHHRGRRDPAPAVKQQCKRGANRAQPSPGRAAQHVSAPLLRHRSPSGRRGRQRPRLCSLSYVHCTVVTLRERFASGESQAAGPSSSGRNGRMQQRSGGTDVKRGVRPGRYRRGRAESGFRKTWLGRGLM